MLTLDLVDHHPGTTPANGADPVQSRLPPLQRLWQHLDQRHADYGIALFLVPALLAGLAAAEIVTCLQHLLG